MGLPSSIFLIILSILWNTFSIPPICKGVQDFISKTQISVLDSNQNDVDFLQNSIHEYCQRSIDDIPSRNETIEGRDLIDQFIVYRLKPQYGEPENPLSTTIPSLDEFQILQLEDILADTILSYTPIDVIMPIFESAVYHYPQLEGKWEPVELFTLLFPNTQLPSILEYLDINRTGTFFHLAVANGYSKIVDSILHRNPVLVHRHDPYSKMDNMRLAVEGGHKTMIEVLVKHGLLPPVLEIEEDAGREEETEDE